MKIEWTENADLVFGTKDFENLKKGIVIFSENLGEAKELKDLKRFIELKFKNDYER